MSTHLILEHADILPDLTDRVTRLAERYEAVFGEGGRDPHALEMAAQWWADLLANKATDDSMGERHADPEHYVPKLLAELIDRAEMDSPPFWRSPLGRAIGWWVGGDPEGVSLGVAAAILGVSRQSVHEARNKLQLGTINGQLSPDSIASRMRRDYPLEGQ